MLCELRPRFPLSDHNHSRPTGAVDVIQLVGCRTRDRGCDVVFHPIVDRKYGNSRSRDGFTSETGQRPLPETMAFAGGCACQFRTQQHVIAPTFRSNLQLFSFRMNNSIQSLIARDLSVRPGSAFNVSGAVPIVCGCVGGTAWFFLEG